MYVSDFCRKNGLTTARFYEIVSLNSKLAQHLKGDETGEICLDKKTEESVMAILRKERLVKKSKSPVLSAQREINYLSAQNAELKREIKRLKSRKSEIAVVVALSAYIWRIEISFPT